MMASANGDTSSDHKAFVTILSITVLMNQTDVTTSFSITTGLEKSSLIASAIFGIIYGRLNATAETLSNTDACLPSSRANFFAFTIVTTKAPTKAHIPPDDLL